MKNIKRPITSDANRSDLVSNFMEMTDEVMIMRHKLLRKEGITRPGLFVLFSIKNKGPQKLTDCSTILGVSKPTVTKIVDNLEKDGYVERIKQGNDRRSYNVHLTDFGKERLLALSRELKGVLLYSMEHLSSDEIKELNTSISSIRERLRSLRTDVGR